MVVTGTSMDRNDQYGCASFFDRETFSKIYELHIEGAVSIFFFEVLLMFVYFTIISSLEHQSIFLFLLNVLKYFSFLLYILYNK